MADIRIASETIKVSLSRVGPQGPAGTASILAEELARIAGDSDLQAQLDAAIVRIAAVEGFTVGAGFVSDSDLAVVDAKVDALEVKHDSEVYVLQETIDNLSTAIINLDSTALQNQLNNLSSTVGGLVTEHDSDVISLQSQIDSIGTDTGDRLDSEILVRAAGDVATLASAQAYTDSEIASLINSAPGALDTLSELAAALDNDSDFATSITTQITNESNARSSADTALHDRLDSELAQIRVEIDEEGASAVNQVTATIVGEDTPSSLNTLKEIAASINNDSDVFNTLNNSIIAVDARVDSEIIARDAAIAASESSLNASINTLDSELDSSVTELNARLDSEYLILQNLIDENELQHEADQQQAEANYEELTGSIAIEGVVRAEGDSELSNRIDSEQTARVAGDSNTLSSAQTYTDNAISDLVDGAPLALDTLNELASALSDDSDALAALTVNLSNESSERVSADDALDTRIDSEQTVRASEVSALTAAIDSEESARIYEDNVLDGRIDSEQAARIAAINTVDSDIATESSARAAADTTLSDRIDSEQLARVASDNTLSNRVDSEEVVRAAEDLALESRIDSEQTARITADATKLSIADFSTEFDSDLATKTTDALAEGAINRYYTDERVDDRVSNLLVAGNNVSLNYNDSDGTLLINLTSGEVGYDLTGNTTDDLSEGASNKYFTDARARDALSAGTGISYDSDTGIISINDAGVATQSELNTVENRLDSEIVVRTNADSTLDGRIDSEATARISGDSSTLSSAQSYTDTAISNLVDGAPLALDTLNELAAALGDDSDALAALTVVVDNLSIEHDSDNLVLTNRIAAEETARTNADSTLDSRIDSEAIARSSADTALDTRIDSEALARISADDALQTNIDTLSTEHDSDVTALEAADSALDSRIDSEAVARAAQDSTLQSNIDTLSTEHDSDVLAIYAELTAISNEHDSDVTAINTDITALDNRVDSEQLSRIAGDSTTLSSAQGYTDTAISNLVNGAPLALDTLKELADALSDDSDALAALTTTVSNETTNRTNADTALDGRIDSESVARYNEDTAINNRIDSEQLARITVDSTKLNISDFGSQFDSDFAAKTTSNLTEGTNKYYTDARVQGVVTKAYVEGLGISSSNVAYDNEHATDLTATTVHEAIDQLNAIKASVADVASNLILYPTTASADVSGYFKLVSSTDDSDYNTTAVDISTGAITGSDVLISTLISDANVIGGNPGVINLSVIGNIRKISGNDDAHFYFTVSVRDSDNNEVLLSTSNQTDTITVSTYEQFAASALLNDVAFASTDRLVYRFYGIKVGTSTDPTYEFQFGGGNPVRALVPLPFSAVPINVDSSNLVIDTANFGGILSASDAILQDALDIIDGVTTSEVPEGSNLYYTDVRARKAIAGSSGISYDSDTGIISINDSYLATQAELDAVSDTLSALSTEHDSDTTSLQSQINTVNSTLSALSTEHDSDVIVLNAAITSGDSNTLSSAQSYTDTAISDLVNGAPLALDTLKELADALSNDSDALAALTTVVDELSQEHDSDTTALQAQIDTINSDVNELSTEHDSDVASLQSQIDAIQASAYDDTAVNDRIDSEAAILSALVAEHDSDTTYLQAQISDLVNEHDSDVTSLQGQISTLDSTLVSLDGTVGTLSGTVSALSTEHDSDITSLQNQITTLDDTVSTLSTEHDSDTASLQGQINTLDSTLTSLDGTVSTLSTEHDSDITSLQGQINTLTSDLSTLSTEHDSDTASLQSQISTLDSTVSALSAEHDSDVTSLQTQITSVDDTLSALSTEHDSDVTALESAISSGDSTTLSSAQSYTDSAISDLVNGAPVALDTLNELATALSDDSDALAALTVLVDNLSTEHDSDVTSLQEQIDTLTSDLSTLSTEHDSDTASLQSQITTVDGTLSTLNNTVSTLSNEHDSDVTSLQSQITALSNEHDSDVTALESSIAAINGLNVQTLTTTSTSAATIASFSATTYAGAKVVIMAHDTVTDERHASELLMTHDGTLPQSVEYGTVTTDAELSAYSVALQNGSLNLRAVPASSNSTKFTVTATLIEI